MKLMQNKCEEVSAMLKHFSHPQRLLILCYLADGEKQVGEIHEAAGLSQSQTSQFLKRMQAEGLLSSRREKNYTYYAILDPAAIKLLKSMHKIFL
jgi:DNA-binding transcriptional ArsR family regulator